VPDISYGFLDEIMTEDDKSFYKQLGKRVAQLRKELQMTQVQLAKILGISQQHVASYECGRRKIPVALLPTLSKLLAVAVEDLLGMKNTASKRGPAPRLQRQIEQIRTLPRTKQRFVMEMLDTVIQQQQKKSG
jgi:transcriptional regulator with XRE-family HTH domain